MSSGPEWLAIDAAEAQRLADMTPERRAEIDVARMLSMPTHMRPAQACNLGFAESDIVTMSEAELGAGLLRRRQRLG